jgi:hypothetical protein
MHAEREKQQTEIESNFVFFQGKLPELLARHRDRFALIRHKEIVDFFDTARDAKAAGGKLFADRMFSVQKVTDSPLDLGIFSHAVHLG